ncbi:MAG: T9SS type A sorting domain-containing protein [Chitinivibrionales bacterium]|nr:T9SS type A sorting domain-containing protein [Chitinivibrionales bacterium]MBD3396615.1 T9SS type A sorting domain-containing protein [Chitinivibrionales bacterium]
MSQRLEFFSAGEPLPKARTPVLRIAARFFPRRCSKALAAVIAAAAMSAFGEFSATVSEVDGDIDVVLENAVFKCTYGPVSKFYTDQDETCIKELVVNGGNDVVGRFYMDAMVKNEEHDRGALNHAEVVVDDASEKTVQLEWDGSAVVQRVTMYPHKPYLKIDYYRYYMYVRDFPEKTGGTPIVYGANDWCRVDGSNPFGEGIFPRSYYRPEMGDPADGGSLNYAGWFIMGTLSGSAGFGRLLPVKHMSVIKLLDPHKGYEFYPHWVTKGSRQPFTSILYIITGGEDELFTQGMLLAENTEADPPAIDLPEVGAIGRAPAHKARPTAIAATYKSGAVLVKVVSPGPHSIRLVDLKGATIMHRTTQGNHTYRVSLDNVAAGMYLMRVKATDKVVNKIIVHHGR